MRHGTTVVGIGYFHKYLLPQTSNRHVSVYVALGYSNNEKNVAPGAFRHGGNCGNLP
jgi:hypothetical protein